MYSYMYMNSTSLATLGTAGGRTGHTAGLQPYSPHLSHHQIVSVASLR